MQVVHYQRKRRKNGNFSLEFIFQDVRNRLADRFPIEVRYAPYHSNGFFRRLAIMLDAGRSRHEVTHVTGDINFAVLGVRKRNALLTILDCGFLNRPSGIRRAVLKKLWLQWPVGRARFITTISEVVKREIIYHSGCPADKIQVIPVSISDQFQPKPACFNSDCPRILHVGTAHNKNLPRVIEAVRRINCNLVIIGQIPADLLVELKSNHIRYENYVELSQDEIIAQYVKCDMLCFPSMYEGFGMPILEAQAVGRPVVTSNCSAMLEVAESTACLVDPTQTESIRSGIQRVIHDSEFRKRLVEDGFENVKRFDPERIAQQYYEVYLSMMSKT